jgi:hypothetical protein
VAPAGSLLLQRLCRASTGRQLQCHNCRLIGLPRVHHGSAGTARDSCGSHSDWQATAAACDAAVINARVKDLLLLLLLLLLHSSQGAHLLPVKSSTLAWRSRLLCRMLLPWLLLRQQAVPATAAAAAALPLLLAVPLGWRAGHLLLLLWLAAAIDVLVGPIALHALQRRGLPGGRG